MVTVRTVLGLWLASCALAVPAISRAAEPARNWIPDKAVLVVEIPQPKQLIDVAMQDKIVDWVTSLPAWKDQMAKAETQEAVNLVEYFQNRFDCDFKTLVSKLTGGGITWAVAPNDSHILIVETEDANMLEEVHDFFLMIARSEARKAGNPNRVTSAEYRGVTGWTFGPKESHAIVDNRLIITNKPEALKAVLDLRAGASGGSIADRPGYSAMVNTLGESAVMAFADWATVKPLPGVQKALKGNENPLGSLLFAPMLAALREGTWVGAGLKLEGDKVRVDLVTDGRPSDPEEIDGFATAEGGGGALPNLEVPGRVAAMSFYRDLHQFYTAKDELFPERTSGLIFFENMMGIFFTGRDLTEEVLAEVRPDVRVVVARQQYDPNVGTPQLELPGFAIVMRMKNPDKFRPIAEEAWQKALGLVNFTRGQKALPGLIIDRPEYKGVKYTMSYFAPEAAGDGAAADVRFNFQPSLAMPGEYLILSSCDSLTRHLIDAVQSEQAEPMGDAHSVVQVDGQGLFEILNANREGLIRQNMIDEGNTREQAEQQIGLVLAVLKHLGPFQLSAGYADNISRVSMELDVRFP